jgi:16S rRNA G966 N2-methylase RsmD
MLRLSWLLISFARSAAVSLPLLRPARAAPPRSYARMDEDPSSAASRLVLVLVTQGLEDVASEYLRAHGLVNGPVEVLAQPRIAIGEAAVGKILARVPAHAHAVQSLLHAPVVQAVLAYVTSADGLPCTGGWSVQENGAVPDGVLAELAALVGTSEHWDGALDLLAASGVRDVSRFRASCACGGREHTGFGSEDAMRALGGGVINGERSPGSDGRWAVDLLGYDVELYGLLCDGCFACGLLLGGEWRATASPARRKFGVAPFCEAAGRPYLASASSPWYMPRLRPSTALLLLLLCGVQPGHALLDPFGGSGTIAIEAAAHLARVNATTSDNHRATSCAAVRNVQLARSSGLADGSSVRAMDWDATDLTSLPEASIDRVVADLPFGHRCRWDVATELPAFLDELARVLRRPHGRAVLLMAGHRRVAQLLETPPPADAAAAETTTTTTTTTCPSSPPSPPPATCASGSSATSTSGAAPVESPPPRRRGLKLSEKRRVSVGGFGCWALTLTPCAREPLTVEPS